MPDPIETLRQAGENSHGIAAMMVAAKTSIISNPIVRSALSGLFTAGLTSAIAFIVGGYLLRAEVDYQRTQVTEMRRHSEQTRVTLDELRIAVARLEVRLQMMEDRRK